MYIIDLGKILPKNLQDKWITFQMLIDLLRPNKIFSLSQHLPGDYLLFFFDGKKQVVLFNYIDPFRNSVWIMKKTKFTFCNNKLIFSVWEGHPTQLKVKLIDFESARKFIDYLELF